MDDHELHVLVIERLMLSFYLHFNLQFFSLGNTLILFYRSSPLVVKLFLQRQNGRFNDT
jgi:hypothetical protein